MHLGAHAGAEGLRVGDQLADPESLGGLVLLGALAPQLGMQELLPLLEQAGVGALEQGAEEAQSVEDRLGAGRLRDALLERLVELGEIAQQHALAALEVVALDEIAEAQVVQQQLAADQLRADVAAADPGMVAAEAVEGAMEEVDQRLRRLRRPDLLETLDR